MAHSSFVRYRDEARRRLHDLIHGPTPPEPNPWTSRALSFADGFPSEILADRSPPGAGEPSPRGELEAYFDSNTTGPGIWKWRHYFPAYESHLGRFRGRPARLLEIGVYSGGSLRMWRSYLGPTSTIVGVDIDESCRAYADTGIEIVIGDQADETFWARFLSDQQSFDIVIDDGGHETHQQVTTLEAVLPRMNAGGVYFCEDVHHEENGFAAYIGGLTQKLHAYEFTPVAGSFASKVTTFQQAVASIHVYPYLVAIERQAHPPDRFVAPRQGTFHDPD